MLKKFTVWVREQENSLKYFFEVEIVEFDNYFTKINLGTNLYLSQIIFWENHNLYEAEILEIQSGETIFIQSGECGSEANFIDLFSDFFAQMGYKFND